MSYESVVLADSPTLLWKLDETSGTAVADATGNGNTATYSGATLASDFLIGPDRNARLDSGDYIESDSPITVAAPFTVEVWTHWDAITADGVWGYAEYLNLGSMRFFLSQSVVGASKTQLISAIYCGFTTSAVELTPLNRLYLAATVSSSGAVFYINGEEVESNDTDFSSWSETDYLGIGKSTGIFSGLVGYAALYPTALSPAQIAAHYAARDQNSSDTGTFTDVGWLSFDKADTDTASVADSALITIGFVDTDTAALTESGAYPTKSKTGVDSFDFYGYVSGTVPATYTGLDRFRVFDLASLSPTLPAPHTLSSALVRPVVASASVAASTSLGLLTPTTTSASVSPNTAVAVIDPAT